MLVEKLLEDEDEDKEDDLVVDGKEDAIFARPGHWLTGRIDINCDAIEHLLTFHYNTFFTLLFI